MKIKVFFFLATTLLLTTFLTGHLTAGFSAAGFLNFLGIPSQEKCKEALDIVRAGGRGKRATDIVKCFLRKTSLPLAFFFFISRLLGGVGLLGIWPYQKLKIGLSLGVEEENESSSINCNVVNTCEMFVLAACIFYLLTNLMRHTKGYTSISISCFCFFHIYTQSMRNHVRIAIYLFNQVHL